MSPGDEDDAAGAREPGAREPGAREPGARDPLHGVTLQAILEALEARYGWEELGRRIEIRCFTHDPSVASSLKFLRKTPWARAKVERLYAQLQRRRPPRE